MYFDLNVPAVTQVSMRFDGPIPPKLMDAARKIDAARDAKIARVRVGAITMHKDTAIDLMAQAIEQAAAKRQCVTREDFARLGLTDAQVDTYARTAIVRAVTEHPYLEQLQIVEIEG